LLKGREVNMDSKSFLIVRRIICLALALVLLYIFPTSPLSAQEKLGKVLKLGATSNFADRQGIQVKRCLELASEQLNKAGGLVVKGEKYHVEMIVYDDKFQADAGRAAFERLVNGDKVKAIFSYGAAPSLAGIEITEPNKVLFFTGTMAPQVLSPKYRYTFRTRANTLGYMASAIFWSKYKESNGKTVVIIANDDHTGRAMAGAVEESWKYNNVKILDRLYFKRGTADLSPIAARLKSINPEITEWAGIMSGAETLRLAKAIYQSGWKGQIVAELAQTTVPDIVNACGKEAVEGMVVMMLDPTVIPDPPPLSLPFRKAYTEKYGEWEIDGLRIFEGWYYFIAALKRANSLEPDDIAEAMQGLSVETVLGTSRMCRRPDLGNSRYVDIASMKYMGRVKRGEVVYVDRVTPIEAIKLAEKIYGGKWE
jgi:ABC-type branched-subunit amino acid transport system substrate-binding protein